jgi:hypothetical protein
MPTRACLLHSLARLGETEPAEQVLAGLGQRDRDRAEMRIAAAVLRSAQDDPRAATASLAPVLDGSAPLARRSWLVEAFMLEAMARDGSEGHLVLTEELAVPWRSYPAPSRALALWSRMARAAVVSIWGSLM